MAAFEDSGFYCVDNMPVALLPKFLELPIESETEIAGIAFVMDLREKGFLAKYEAIFASLKKKGYHFEILFLEAEEDVLVQRYSTTRRQHPLSLIDTSNYNVHELKANILELARRSRKLAPMRIQVVSFGFKFGVPRDADLIIDVRFLINPYFVPELKALDGEDRKIRDFVLDHAETRVFLKKYLDPLDYLIPMYEKEGKAYLTIAVGCTGGRHRSVTIARTIYDHIRKTTEQVEIIHRDIHQAS